MDRSNIDPFWNHVVKVNDGSMKCEFCGHPFAKDTSISRIKWHLSGEKGRGVAICGQVPKQVQEAVFLAMRGGNKRHKSIATSSNVNDNAIASCPQEENNEVDNLATDVGRIQMAVQGTEQRVGEGRTSSLAKAGNRMENMAGEMMHIDRSITAEELIVDALETREEASLAPDLMGRAFGSSWDDICNLLMEDDIENGTEGVAQPGAGASSSGGLTRNTNESIGDALPTTKLVGQAFEDNKKTIWSWLMNDEISSIGIYGMGGVGKTTLVTQIYNQLLELSDTFFHVYWITVSQDFSINKLQNSIARRIGLHLFDEEEELHRAIKLSKELRKRQKWVLILDDLWNYFELHKVGVPVQIKGCKVILTTRSEKVCQRMDSQKKIKVKPLSKEEAWTLFMEKLRHDQALSPEVTKIAQSITEECAGLPLAIITMAGTMKGVDDIHEWRDVLEDLKQSRVRQDDMEAEVFRILRFSYMHLKDSALQQCFLYCALFPEDFEIPRGDLIAYLIDEGIIKGMKSREAEFDKGHSMLNRLENVCLLESGKMYDDCRCVKMHDLIRDMAIQLQQGNFEVMVKAGTQLKELPDAEEWTENLVRVSLMENHIIEVPSSYSPWCLNLSTLLLCLNRQLKFIADSFFKEMHRLKILDLSHTNIKKLPNSISDLVSLRALLLQSCKQLRHIPSLKKLRALKKLDLSCSTLEKMPQGMECLSNLRFFRLNGCSEKEFPSGILPKLSHLQVFVLEEELVDGEYIPVTVEGKEVACLTKLETLKCHFEGFSDFVEYLKSRDETQSPRAYTIFVGQLDAYDYLIMMNKCCRNRSVGLCNSSITRYGSFQVMFPNDIEELIICKCDVARSLCDVFSSMYAAQLEHICISDCNSMESLVSSSWFRSAPLPSPSDGIFSGLKEFECYRCTSMKKLFPIVLLQNLVNLELISVRYCEKMEIIATRDEEGAMGEESNCSTYFFSEFSLPKLRGLNLECLPELKSICSAELICNSLEEIFVWECPQLKKMSISLPLLENGQPSPPPSLRRMGINPKEWWESVEWGHPNAKDVLRPFLWFWDPTTESYLRLDTIHQQYFGADPHLQSQDRS